jgi:hypothetical protein
LSALGEAQAVIHEISETGLLLESSLPLAQGERLDVIMPDRGARQVKIVWACGRYFGGEFEGHGTALEVRPVSSCMDALPKKGSPEAVALAAFQLHELSMAIERISSVLDRAIYQLSK